MSPNHPNCRCIDQEHEIAPLAIARPLVCYGGPWDGERRLLEAGESEIQGSLSRSGHFAPFGCFI